MSHITHTVIHRYLPPSVKRIIARGADCWIGEVDSSTILKYPQIQGKRKPELQIEAKMLNILGCHPHIVQSRGLTEDGLLLEFAPNGSLHDYLSAHPDTALEQRLAWCIQVARGTCLERLVKDNCAPSNEEASRAATSWLSGLCEEQHAPKVPPPMRQLIGFD